jgi:hypothetical protein
MISRLVQLSLVALTLVGLVMVWQSGHQRSAARAEYERLARLTGDLKISDPQKVHVLALETGEPLHFAWRVYLPPNCRTTVRYEGGGSTSNYSQPQNIIARVRFREHPPGRLQVYTKFAGSSSQSGFGDEALASFLQDRWDQIRVEQLGTGQTALVKLDEEAVLLKLSLPDDLAAQASKEIDLRRHPIELPVLCEMQILLQPKKP